MPNPAEHAQGAEPSWPLAGPQNKKRETRTDFPGGRSLRAAQLGGAVHQYPRVTACYLRVYAGPEVNTSPRPVALDIDNITCLRYRSGLYAICLLRSHSPMQGTRLYWLRKPDESKRRPQ
jgi:hypothetical protein